jgi:hypothetical protein
MTNLGLVRCRVMQWRRLTLLAASVLTLVACQSTSQQPPAAVTDTSGTSSTSDTSTAKPITYVTLPDTYGQNAEEARMKLQDLGLTKVELASSNSKFSTVEEAKDWKVVGMVPGAGTVVKSDEPVVLNLFKVR